MPEAINYEKSSATPERVPRTLADQSAIPLTDKKLGIALVGLGKYATEQLGPALRETHHCFLAGIVTGTPSKVKDWQTKYSIPEENIYSYDNFEEIKHNENIDILYIALPNALHAEFVIKGARCGKHIICEKPMAVSVDECDEMIRACKDAGVMLSIGYRLHFEPHHRDVMKMGQAKIFGALEAVSAKHGSSDTAGWRLDKKLSGGGPLMDLGIYCIQAARYVSGKEPIAVKVLDSDNPKENEIERRLKWEMEFPDHVVATCETSYETDLNSLHADAAHGWFELAPAYQYEGISGKTATGFIDLPEVNQQALQMDDFALSILTNKPSKVPGEMGRTDMKIIEAIYESLKTGKRIELT
jgi:predicted dehydrogenase